jgi:NADPH2:quinone reductase
MNEHDATHRAWRCHAFGDYHDLKLEQLPALKPGPKEISVRVRAFALGFPEMLMVQGLYQLKPPLPFTAGAEFAGVVQEVGSEVTDFARGQAVMGGVRFGASATQVVAAEDNCAALPANFDFAQGAAFGVAFKTAYVGLVVRGGLQAGETVLIHGAAGGVGLAAVQLAHALGARVLAMANGPEKIALARQYGAVDVIDYRDGPFREVVKALTAGRGVDVVYDPVGGDVFDESLHCVAPFGRVLIIGFTSGRIPTLRVNHALLKQYAVIGVRAGEYGRVYPEGGRVVHQAMSKWAASGKLNPHIHARLAFAQVREGFDEIAGRRAMGRIIVEVRD